MEGCILCREISNTFVDIIKVSSTQWDEFQIKSVIDQHLWPLETIPLSSWLCTTCWQELYDFHNFYKRIEDVHKNKSLLMKLEFSNESHIEPQISIPEIQSPKLIIEQNIIIKEEHEEDIWDDDVPLMQISKRIRIRQATTDAEKTLVEDPLNSIIKSKETNSKKLEPKNKKTVKSVKTLTEISTTKQTQEYSENNHDSEALEINEEVNSSEDTDTDSNYEPDKESPTTNENKSCHNTSKPNNRDKDQFLAKNFKIACIICKTPAETFQALCKHFKDNHNQRGYVSCCNKQYFKRNLLLDHVHQHLDPSYLKCNHCGKVLANRRCLKFHKKIHDTEREKNHCCDICGLRFVTSHRLHNHKSIHLSEEEKLFPCSECGKNFGTKWTLINHVKLIHESTISCDICGLLLVNKSVLNRHKYLKHPEGGKTEYTCPICSKISTNRHAHGYHIKYAHHTDYNYKCTMCEKAFKKPRSLREHVATHTGTDLYTCPWCPRTCKSSAYMHKHRKKCHPKEWEEKNRKKYSRTLPSNDELTSANIFND